MVCWSSRRHNSDTYTAASPPFSLVRNAASSRSEGVELDSEWIIAEGFRVSADVTYDDSRYLTYSNVSATQLQQLLGETSQSLTGRPTEFAPVWSGTLSKSYTVKFSAFRLTTALTEIASSSYYLTGNDDPTVEQSPYFRLDARTSLETADGRWALDVIAKNITNRDI